MVREAAAHVGVAVPGQYADQVVVDRGVRGEVCPYTGDRVRGEPSAHRRRQVRTGGQGPAQQEGGVFGEVDGCPGRGGRVLKGSQPCVVGDGLVGAVARGAREQIAVGPRAVRIVGERNLLAVADQAVERGRQSCAGDQCRECARRCRLVGRHRTSDLGVGVPGEPGGHVQSGPPRQLGDHVDVRVRGEPLHHIGREPGAGGQLRPPLPVRIRCEEARPLRAAGSSVEQGQGHLRVYHGIDVGGGQPALVREPHRAVFGARHQCDRLVPAEIRTAGEDVGEVVVRERDQPVDRLGRQ